MQKCFKTGILVSAIILLRKGNEMHELGVLMEAVKTVNRIAEQNNISKVKHMTLEVGETSGYVPMYFMKLFPVAIDSFEVMKDAELKIVMAPGKGLQIKDIGY